jgi:hypothetical protein
MTDHDEWHLKGAKKRQEDHYGRIGKCRVCGEPILWWNTLYRTRVPLDPVPVLNITELIGHGDFYVPKGKTAAVKLNTDETGNILVYRVHNDGVCLRDIEASEPEPAPRSD